MIQSRSGHNSTIITKDLLIAVEIGLQAPLGFIPVIPKYVLCNKSAWKRKNVNFCRILEEYGPLGISDAIKNSKIKMIYDPIYRAMMPYIRYEDIMFYYNPRDVFADIFVNSSKSDLKNHTSLFDLIDDMDITKIGITGSYSLGINNENSDIDLVVYGNENSEIMYEKFVKKAKIIECKDVYGGVIIKGKCFPWRRGMYEESMYSWTGVPEKIADHCKILNEYKNVVIPEEIKEMEINIPEGQSSALLYPPCVKDSNDRYIVSFEYNAGNLLYIGGNLTVSGLFSDKIILIGTREYPGKLISHS